MGVSLPLNTEYCAMPASELAPPGGNVFLASKLHLAEREARTRRMRSRGGMLEIKGAVGVAVIGFQRTVRVRVRGGNPMTEKSGEENGVSRREFMAAAGA